MGTKVYQGNATVRGAGLTSATEVGVTIFHSGEGHDFTLSIEEAEKLARLLQGALREAEDRKI